MGCVDLLGAFGLVVVGVTMRQIAVVISLGHPFVADESSRDRPVYKQGEGDHPPNNGKDITDQCGQKRSRSSGPARYRPGCYRNIDDGPDSLNTSEFDSVE